MIRSLGIDLLDLHVPHAASIVFEVHERPGDTSPYLAAYFVKDVKQPAVSLQDRYCKDSKNPCQFDDLFSNVKFISSEIFDLACNNTDPADNRLTNVNRCFVLSKSE
jgi:hypothetical protein